VYRSEVAYVLRVLKPNSTSEHCWEENRSKSSSDQLTEEGPRKEIAPAEERTMIKMFVVVLGVNLGAALGWWLGSRIGLMTGYFVAIFGASIGLYLSRQYSRNYLD
jgi:hypothetical protein